jgi:hypothetical protein
MKCDLSKSPVLLRTNLTNKLLPRVVLYCFAHEASRVEHDVDTVDFCTRWYVLVVNIAPKFLMLKEACSLMTKTYLCIVRSGYEFIFVSCVEEFFILEACSSE